LAIKNISEKERVLLNECVSHFDKEDRAVRERQIRTWRRLKLFWEGYHKTWYSETAHDWRIWDSSTQSTDDGDQAYYDKSINVFRAYVESIIAALSVVVPPIKCYPDDADNTLDLATANAGDKICELIYRHNDVQLLWLHILFIFCTEGMVACYSYPKEDEAYGTYEKKNFTDSEETNEVVKCPNCGYTLEERPVNPEQQKLKADEFQPDEEYAEGVSTEDSYASQGYGDELCPACNSLVSPDISNETFTVTRLVGVTNEPKTRICMEAYGGLYVKVPSWARKQSDCLYLIYSYETHYANAIEQYAHLHGKLNAEKIKANTGIRDPYEQWGRLSPQYNGEYPNNNVTIHNSWLRPAAFNIIKDEDDVNFLKDKYPNGVKIVHVNDELADAVPETLDDCWTLTYNPLSDYIHYDPLGLLLVSVQEITSDLISLILQTIEHGIGQTFADPGVLDFDGYQQQEALPGGVYEATPKSGKSLSDGFYQAKTATLSPEVMPFADNIQSLAQLVSGALPSLFGGAVQGGGTASEYSMSRAQALQRLQNTWKMLTSMWKNVFGKAIPAYIKEVKEDEKDVRLDTNGNFINVFIRKAELEGKIGKIELEANENLPLTWSQQKDIIMILLQAANPQVLAILGAPENLPKIRQAIGLNDFIVPGEADRNKQYDEIKELLNSAPLQDMDPMTGQPTEVSSVEIDPVYDSHEIEFEIVRGWVVGEAGRIAKIDNPEGYKNVLLHGYEHYKLMGQEGAAMAAQNPDGAQTEQPIEDINTPITGEENVSAEV
jgi:hypothetical protein